jgi:hypothetical protein
MSGQSMNKLMKLLSVTLVLLSLSLFAQDDKGNEERSPNFGSQDSSGSGSTLTNYSPLAVYDYRMTVKNISFSKRHALSGRGEVLDVQVDMFTQDTKDNKYSIYVLALNESNAVEPVARALAPHPSWRPLDPKKDKKMINFTSLVAGKKIPKEELMKAVWDNLKPQGTGLFDKRTFDERKKEIADRQTQGQRVTLGEPDLEEYILYLSQNPGDAKEFSLFGTLNGPEPAKYLEADYKGITEEENTKDIYASFPDHTYTFLYDKTKTSVITHHYSEYRPDFFFFNKVVILIFDPSRDKNKLVHRSIHDLGKMKIRN